MVSNLRILRMSKGISQQQLAKILQVSQPRITQIEKGQRPTIDRQIKLEELFGYPFNFLISDVAPVLKFR